MSVANLIIPVINRPDLLIECIRSIDTVVERLLIIDNSRDASIGRIAVAEAEQNVNIQTPWVIYPWMNMGVAASWNFGIKQFRGDPYWIIANADTKFGKGDLYRLSREMETETPRWVGVNGDWRVFGINRSCVDKVGFFDENFHPIYCEDADYERRCTLVGVAYDYIIGDSTHVGSVSWTSDETGRRNNARTYAKNVSYYVSKWGGPPRSGERFTTPFDLGRPVDYWPVNLTRVASLDWD